MLPIAVLDLDTRSPGSPLRQPELARRLTRIDCYAIVDSLGSVNVPGLGGRTLEGYAALVVPAMVDQEHLSAQRTVIRRYLDGGGVVLFGGHLHRHWLPGAFMFVPLEIRAHRDYEVAWVGDHPIFDGVDPSDLTYRRGVAGFFARGHHPPPDGAEVLVRLVGGQPVTYLDRCSTAGTILVQSSGDLWGYYGLDSTAARIPGQLLDWIETEAAERRSRLQTTQ
jgi:hypothetical protein